MSDTVYSDEDHDSVRSSMAPVLPLEIFDLIMHARYDDKPFLALCSLVCKDWLPCSRSLLFGQVELNQRNSESFMALLNSPSSTLVNRIKHLGVEDGHLAELVLNMDALSLNPITSLSISFSEDSPPKTPSLSSGFRGIRNLDLDMSNFACSSVAFGFMAQFRQLETLSLQGVTFETRDPPYKEHISPTLTCLKLRLFSEGDVASYNEFLTWFLAASPRPHIRRLEARSIRSGVFPSFLRLMESLEDDLEDLALGFHGGPGSAEHSPIGNSKLSFV